MDNLNKKAIGIEKPKNGSEPIKNGSEPIQNGKKTISAGIAFLEEAYFFGSFGVNTQKRK